MLLCWLCLLPFAQTLHLRFADHGHRYCPIHHQIEDVFDSPEVATGSSPYGSINVDASGADGHVPCSVLNADSVSESMIARTGSVRQRIEAGLEQKTNRESHPRYLAELILVAPKNSPPVTNI